jgi:hypothetical protein
MLDIALVLGDCSFTFVFLPCSVCFICLVVVCFTDSVLLLYSDEFHVQLITTEIETYETI